MSVKVASYVLDSYALLALLEDEPGAERVSEVIADSATAKYMSVVNFGGCYTFWSGDVPPRPRKR